MSYKLKIGVLVSPVDEDIKGRVIAIDGTNVCIEDFDGFERIFQADDLIIYDDTLSGDTTSFRKDKVVIKSNEKSRIYPEIIDLHNKNKYLSKNTILDTQIKIFKSHLNQAIGKRQLRIIFIHGKGEGVLRASLEKVLKQNKIPFSDASYHKFGGGAIEVFLNGIRQRVH